MSRLGFKSVSISCISAMNSCSTTKVGKCNIYLAICCFFQLCVIAEAGIFSELLLRVKRSDFPDVSSTLKSSISTEDENSFNVDDTCSNQKRTVYIPSFKYEMCNHDYYKGRYSFWFKDLDIMATSYGDVDVTGTFVTMRNLTSPVKATVNLKRKILGMNIKIPCIKNFGSCTYNDICAFGYTENEECPPLLEEYDIPCRCPVEPGVYNIPGVQIKEMARSRWATLLAGKYNAMIKLYKGDTVLTCYRIYFTLA